MEQPNNAGEMKELEQSELPLGSTAEEEGGQQQALDEEVARLSHKRKRLRSPFLKVPIAVVVMALLALLAYSMSALMLKDSKVTGGPGAGGIANLLSFAKGGKTDKSTQKDSSVSSGGAGVSGEPQQGQGEQQQQQQQAAAPATPSPGGARGERFFAGGAGDTPGKGRRASLGEGPKEQKERKKSF